MKPFFSRLVLAFSLLLVPALGQNTTVVSGTLLQPSGQGQGNSYVRFDLQYCGGNAGTIVGAGTIVSTPMQVQTSVGVWSSPIYGNDKIMCGTATGTSRWRITPYINGAAGPAVTYWIHSGGTFAVAGAPSCPTSAPPTVSCAMDYLPVQAPPFPTQLGPVSSVFGLIGDVCSPSSACTLPSLSIFDLRAVTEADAPTPPTSDSSTKIATTAFVKAQSAGAMPLPATAQIGDTVRFNTAGDGAWDAANFAPQTQIINVLNGSINGIGLYPSVNTVGSGANSFPTATTGWTVTYTSAATASLNTVAGLYCCENGNNTSFGILSFYRYSMKLAINRTTNARFWIGMANYNVSGTPTNNQQPVGGTAMATDVPNHTLIGFRYSAGTDTHWQAATAVAGGSATIVDTGVTADTNPHLFEMTPNATGTAITYLIDGVVVATISTNLPNPAATWNSLASPFWSADNKNTATAVGATFYWAMLSFK